MSQKVGSISTLVIYNKVMDKSKKKAMKEEKDKEADAAFGVSTLSN